jgi:hypothetical protein
MTQGINLTVLNLDESSLDNFVSTLVKFLRHNLHHLFFYSDDENNIFYDHDNLAGTFYMSVSRQTLDFCVMESGITDHLNAGLITVQTVKYMAVLFEEIDRLSLKDKDLDLVMTKLNLPTFDEESTESDDDDDDDPDFEWL